MTTLDGKIGARSFLAMLALSAAAFMVLALSDEPTSGARDRVARLSALLPLLGFAAASLVRERMHRRGELRALAASGIPETRGLRALSVVTAAAGAMGALGVLAAGRADALLPALPAPPFSITPDGIAAPGLGLSLTAAGAAWGEVVGASPRVPSLGPLALGVLLTGAALAELGAHRGSLGMRAGSALALSLSGLVALHAGTTAFVATSAGGLALVLATRVVWVNRKAR